MKLFISLFFVFLGVAFFELSGGSGFDPEAARVSAVEMRTERNVARAALSGFVAGTTSAAVQGDGVASTRETVTRQELNLVSFETIATPTPPQPQDTLAAPAAPTDEDQAVSVALSDLSGTVASGPDQISMAALDNVAAQSEDPDQAPNTRFEGRSAVSSSLPEDNGPDIRAVSGTLVNMRSGPSTDFEVIDQLTQGTQVEVVSDSGDGWVELRPLSGGTTGWIAEFLLTGG